MERINWIDWAKVTIANFALEHLLNLNDTITYQWYEALPLALFIVAFLYLIIFFAKSTIPIHIGRKKA